MVLKLAAQALAHAEEIAHSAGAKLVLLRVLENPLRFLTALPSMGGQGIGVGARGKRNERSSPHPR